MRKTMTGGGFSLLELLVVLAIVGILAMAGGQLISTAEARLKAQTFNVVKDFKLARFEAVKSGSDVLVDLIRAGETDDDGAVAAADGYRICLDLDSDANCDSDDTMIAKASLQAPVTFYDRNFPPPAGPHKTVSKDPWPAEEGGISFSGNRFVMHPDGFGNKGGTVYLYVPDGRDGIGAGPLAVVLSGVGRLRVLRWRPELLAWSR
jgi:prepilin-type N-terminal cleavage/methylation domain-containing protein